MGLIRRCFAVAALAGALFAVTTSPAAAIVGGSNAPAGKYPAIAEVSFPSPVDAFLCTGTLIAPNWVLSAGHCGSITGALVASPVAWPAPLITVRIGGTRLGQGEKVPVDRVVLNPKYLLTLGYDITLIHLMRNSTKAPAKVAGAGERSLWDPGDLEEIVGWGETSDGGALPDVLQQARVPITTDPYCANAYPGDFDVRTMVCAGYPNGGVDTCHGDSGGPMFGRTSAGALRVVGATSFGEGCAQPGKPGIYARVADTILREWIRSKAPAGVN